MRNRYSLVGDLCLIFLSAVASFALRLDVGPVFAEHLPALWLFAQLAVIVKPITFYVFGLYRRYWTYFGVPELAAVAAAVSTSSALLGVLIMVALAADRSVAFPRSVLLIDWLLTLASVGAIRLLIRLVAEARRRALKIRPVETSRRVLIVGAGDAGVMVAREIRANPNLNSTLVGFLDDDRAKIGRSITGVSVLGSRLDLTRVVHEREIDEIIIAMPTAPGPVIREVVSQGRSLGLACKTLPGLFELISGAFSFKQVRDVQIEDLLRRQAVRMNSDTGKYLTDATVLITGAGGSIGSELCRQIAPRRPARLVLLGHGENSIFDIARETRERFPWLRADPVIADIRDGERLRTVFSAYLPDVVFHAAAYKHVPLMESNVVEAVTNNVFGTAGVLAAAESAGVKRFVLISTDKAVNPVNVMGATKRLAEMLVQDVASRLKRPFVVVRFGNVLGSRGSVIPLFQRQIAIGGPVTVTHPDMRRFFMTIPEAVHLVIQASTLGTNGEVFVLDMGQPVRIVDVAHDLIELSGFEVGRNIEIVFTGARPGEKLSEELFAQGETHEHTGHAGIFVIRADPVDQSAWLAAQVGELVGLAQVGDVIAIQAKLREIVPGYGSGELPSLSVDGRGEQR